MRGEGEPRCKHKRSCPSRQVREDSGGHFQLMGARLSSVLPPSFAWRLAVFYAALFVALGVQLPFLPLWLAAKGLDAGAIGIALAVPMIVRVFAIPLATRSADRHDALRMAIVIAAGMAVLGYGAVGIAQGAAAITLALALASVFYTPIMPLADAYALRGLGRLGRAYGPVRLWGSAAFIVGSFGAACCSTSSPRVSSFGSWWRR